VPRAPAPAIEGRLLRAARDGRIYGELLRRKEHQSLMLFTADEELALALRATCLPGQRAMELPQASATENEKAPEPA